MSDFHTYNQKSLDNSLQPTEISRLLRKDIERSDSLPMYIAKGAKKSGTIFMIYYANASAGTFTGSASLSDLSLSNVPLSMCWCIGVVDIDGIDLPGGGLLPTDVLGGTTKYTVTKSAITVTITSTNVGWPNKLEATFYYAIYYDEINKIVL